ncbi:MAG TPA: helix-turn-helix domain-containing protein, partial [bacterium]|nr:helix-turn-helix domain-containing protein [bacterium]
RRIVMDDIEKLFTLKEASEILKVHPNTILRWAKAGKISLVFLPVGNRPRIKKSELNRIMNETKKDNEIREEKDLLWFWRHG